jgi:putative transposase
LENWWALKINGDTKYLYALMDDETRFWIAQQVADTKYTANIRPMFKEAKQIADKRPEVLLSVTVRLTFMLLTTRSFSRSNTPEQDTFCMWGYKVDHNNNKMERMNGEIRDREKTMRGLKKADTPILRGYQIYHNYISEHEGLGD